MGHNKKMDVARIILKAMMWFLIIGFFSNFVLKTLSYSFYKGKRQKTNVTATPQKLTFSEKLTGYGYHLTNESTAVILCFGGSFYVAYNTVGIFASYYDVPFLSVDYYGTQDSLGKMNLRSMQASAEDFYDWVKEQYGLKLEASAEAELGGENSGYNAAAKLAGEVNISSDGDFERLKSLLLRDERARLHQVEAEQRALPGRLPELIGDALGNAPGLEELSRLAYEKTQGNAFFLLCIVFIFAANFFFFRLIIYFEQS